MNENEKNRGLEAIASGIGRIALVSSFSEELYGLAARIYREAGCGYKEKEAWKQQAESILEKREYREYAVFEKAARAYRKAGMKEEMKEAWKNAGDAHIAENHFDEAVKAYQKIGDENIRKMLDGFEADKANMSCDDMFVFARLKGYLRDPEAPALNKHLDSKFVSHCCAFHNPEMREASVYFAEKGFKKVAEKMLEMHDALPARWEQHGRY